MACLEALAGRPSGLIAALGKWTEGGWVGEGAGGAVKGFAQGAMAQTTGVSTPR